MRPVPDRRGIAVPLVLGVLMVTAMLIAGMTVASRQEGRMGRATEGSFEAFSHAERGVSEVVAAWGFQEFQTLEVMGAEREVADEAGRWNAVVRRIGERVYFVESTGGDPAGNASRRVGALVHAGLHETGDTTLIELVPQAALATSGSVVIRGTAEIAGKDSIPPEWTASDDLCPPLTPGVYGVAAGDSVAYPGSRGAGAGAGSPVTGVPSAVDAVDAGTFLVDSDGTPTVYGWEVLVGRAGIVIPAGSTITSLAPALDADGRCDPSSSTNWGDPLNPLAPCGGYFPVIHAQGNLGLSSSSKGQGVLLVDGDLRISGGFEFYGIIMVRGALSMVGKGNKISGAIFVQESMEQSDTGAGAASSSAGNASIQYSWCAVQRALGKNSSIRMEWWADLGGIW